MRLPQAMIQIGTGADLIEMTGGITTDDGSDQILTHTGPESGTIRQSPIMFLEHDGRYLIVASMPDGRFSAKVEWGEASQGGDRPEDLPRSSRASMSTC